MAGVFVALFSLKDGQRDLAASRIRPGRDSRKSVVAATTAIGDGACSPAPRLSRPNGANFVKTNKGKLRFSVLRFNRADIRHELRVSCPLSLQQISPANVTLNG